MKRTYEKDNRPVTSAKPTTLNLQTRPFAPIQSDESQVNETAEGKSIQAKGFSSENLLEKLISTPKTESSVTPIRRKSFPSMRVPIQAKLSIGEPNDKYEKEADNTAAKVVQQINSSPQDSSVQRESMGDELQMKPAISTIQREERMEEDEELQTKSLVQRRENLGEGEASEDLESSIQSARGSGQSLDTNLQAKMGDAMGADFSGVKVHTDSQSDQLNKSIQAKAFTTGQDVFFRQGEYNPTSKGGQELIAHELTHVVQQGATVKRKLSKSTDKPIQRLMSSNDFKNATKARFHKRKRIAEIDDCLKKIEQSGADSILLSELLNTINLWLKVADKNSERKAGVEKLRGEVVAEITKISESLSNEVNSEEMPTTRKRSEAFSATVTGAGKTYSGDFSDFDSKQFRVSGRAPNRRIEEVKRKQMQDGKVIYYAMGLVTGFNGKAPMIAPYPEPIALGDWYPQVTHINGMAVAPKSGILSAAALQESVNKALDSQNDMALGQDAIDILYTYSAQRGGTVGDVIDCIKGKVQVRDAATEKQEEIMLDAVHRQQRVTLSAHSRGTIKTDNAVRNAHEILTKECLPAVRDKRYQEVLDYWQANDPEIGIEPEILAELSLKGFAAKKAKSIMNKFIHLIYAGNAVQYPSAFIDINIYVGGLDPVSMFVGTYSEIGRKIDAAISTGGSNQSKLHSVGRTKGHSFVGNYIPAVSQEIAKDIKKR